MAPIRRARALRAGPRLLAAPAAAGLLAACAAAQSNIAHADIAAFARACGDPEAAPTEIVKNCSRALRTGELGSKGAAQAFLNRGAAFASLGRPDQALNDFDAAAASYAEIAAIWSNRGRALLRLERPQEALQSYERALSLAPGDAESELGRATALIELGAADQALPILESLLDAAPRNLRVRYQRARALAATNNPDAALADVDAVLDAAPNAVAAILLRAQVLEERDPAEAEAAYAAAIDVAPDDPRAHYRRGRLRDRTGGAGAIDDLKRAWELGYRDEWLNNRLLAADE